MVKKKRKMMQIAEWKAVYYQEGTQCRPRLQFQKIDGKRPMMH